jgi:hypothetical protein
MTYDLRIRFDTSPSDHAKAFVNDVYIGRVRIRGGRLCFRCSRNPFTNFITTPAYLPIDELTIAELIERNDTKVQLIPVIIRNYLRNTSFLHAHRNDQLDDAA